MTNASHTENLGRLSPLRLILGILFALLALVLLACFAWGLWNPQQYVVLLSYCGSPITGVFAVVSSAAVAFWLFAPVRNEAAQSRRNAIRLLLVAAAIMTFICFVIGSSFDYFRYRGRVIAHAPAGNVALALVDRGQYGLEVRVWSGSGITTRDLGGFGLVCGDPVKASFTAPDEVLISTNYGDFHLRVDGRGKPLTHKSSDSCSR